jgi:F-type H+-transporting ATPase subunit b
MLAFLAEDPARTKSWIWPETDEIIYGGLASLIIFWLLWKFAGPAVKKAMADRTARIQGELDNSANAKAAAQAEAASIRKAAGDIESERQRLLADADAQADAMLRDGRARLEQEAVDLEARADADIAAIGGRVNDELRAEIARLAGAATDSVLAGEAIDATTHQNLIEAFIAKVGASS